MSNVTTLPAQPAGVIATMAQRFDMHPQAFEATIRATCMPKGNNQREATREEFAAFLLVAKEYGLNPLTKEIYAFPAKGGGIVPVVGIDGWVHLVNEHPQMDGMEFETLEDDKKNLVGMTCRIFRKDRSKPIQVTEYYDECKRNTDPWAMKYRMMRHKSLIQCARYAFGFSNLYDEDEAREIAQIPSIAPVSSGPPPAPPVVIEHATDQSRIPERDVNADVESVRTELTSTNSEIAGVSPPPATDAAAGDPAVPNPAAASTTEEQIDDEIPDWDARTDEIVDHYVTAKSVMDVQEIHSLYADDYPRLNRRQQQTVDHARESAMDRLAALAKAAETVKAAAAPPVATEPPSPPPAPKEPDAGVELPATPPAPAMAIPEDPRTPEEYGAWWTDFLTHATRSIDIRTRWQHDTDKRDSLQPPPTSDERKKWRKMGDDRSAQLKAQADAST